ncbi:MAG: DUF3726 domain-containing protein [Alphaproteobacteria bacterium]|nr:DUF3726 domain-containing protein [Alphaproteobacteria bacterium]
MFSLNEIEAMGKRAARGAGLSWGLAEEAGKAARWLSAQNLPGPDLLFSVLQKTDGRPPSERAPVSITGVWQAPAGPLCPLVTGSTLCDQAPELADGRTIRLGPTLQPLLLAPYLAAAAKLSGSAFELAWDDVVLLMDAETLSYADDETSLNPDIAQSVRCRQTASDLRHPRKKRSVLAVNSDVWEGLNILAMRTFAPATEASRVAGAGTELSDND